MSETPEMTAGADTLAWEVFRSDNSNATEDILRADFPAKAEYALNIAKHLRAAGYRRPRTVTTVEELDALPAGTVIRDGDPLTCVKWGSGNWGSFSGASFPQEKIALPATVLHEPDQS